MSQEKQAVRERALKFRNAIEAHPDHAEDAAKNFLDTVSLKPDFKVALYYPIEKELDTLPLAEALWARGIICLLPVFTKDSRIMQFAKWDRHSKLIPGAFDVPAPEKPEFLTPDILVVPLVAFDQRGHRLGFGMGYFDATLKELRGKRAILAVGYAYAEQSVIFGLPYEDHDQKLDMVVTPQRVFDFRP